MNIREYINYSVKKTLLSEFNNTFDGTFMNEYGLFVNESLGISDIVNRLVYDISCEIVNKYNNKEYKSQNTKSGIEVKIIDGVYTSSDRVKKVYYKVTVFDFKDKSDFIKNSDSLDIDGGKSFYMLNRISSIYINTYAINGKIKKLLLMNTLQHELEHVFQYSMSNSGVIKGKAQKDYLASITTINNDINTIDAESAVSNIIYYSNRFEQEGFANGLYAYFKESESMVPTYDDLYKTDEWKRYRVLVYSLNYVRLNRDECQKVLDWKYRGKKVDTLIQIGERGEYEFKYRLFRVLVKLREELISEGKFVSCDGRVLIF